MLILPVFLYACEACSLALRGRAWAEGIREQDTEESIWTQEGWNDRNLEDPA
jgi:hypothetical protein